MLDCFYSHTVEKEAIFFLHIHCAALDKTKVFFSFSVIHQVIQHLSGLMWTTRSDSCFHGKPIRSPFKQRLWLLGIIGSVTDVISQQKWSYITVWYAVLLGTIAGLCKRMLLSFSLSSDILIENGLCWITSGEEWRCLACLQLCDHTLLTCFHLLPMWQRYVCSFVKAPENPLNTSRLVSSHFFNFRL